MEFGFYLAKPERDSCSWQEIVNVLIYEMVRLRALRCVDRTHRRPITSLRLNSTHLISIELNYTTAIEAKRSLLFRQLRKYRIQIAQLSQRDRATHELLRFAKLRSGIFEPPFWGLRGNVDASCVRRWKKHGQVPIGDN